MPKSPDPCSHSPGMVESPTDYWWDGDHDRCRDGLVDGVQMMVPGLSWRSGRRPASSSRVDCGEGVAAEPGQRVTARLGSVGHHLLDRGFRPGSDDSPSRRHPPSEPVSLQSCSVHESPAVRAGTLPGGLPYLALGRGEPLVYLCGSTANHRVPRPGVERRMTLKTVRPLVERGYGGVLRQPVAGHGPDHHVCPGGRAARGSNPAALRRSGPCPRALER